jgi:starch-binding outer membrane protein SusE/F
MKNTFKIIIAAFLFIGMSSCSDEENFQILEPQGTFAIVTPETGTSIVLDAKLQNNPATTLTWAPADYATPTEVLYAVEIAKTGTEFAEIIPAGSTTGTHITWSVADLNSAAVAAGLLPFEQGSIDIRVKSTVAGGQPQYSDVVNLFLTPFSTALPQLAVPGNHQGWSPKTAPRIASSAFGKTDYEGYVWLDGGHKLVGPDAKGIYDWSAGPDWGDDGSFTGKLLVDNEKDLNAATPGYYLIKADTEKLTYSETKTTWAIIGNATPGGWSTDTPMTYDPATKKWTVIATLSTQSAPNDGLKFRPNGDWPGNYGDSGADGLLDGDGTNISTTEGTYLITLDLSNPRAYTYSFVKQ